MILCFKNQQKKEEDEENLTFVWLSLEAPGFDKMIIVLNNVLYMVQQMSVKSHEMFVSKEVTVNRRT